MSKLFIKLYELKEIFRNNQELKYCRDSNDKMRNFAQTWVFDLDQFQSSEFQGFKFKKLKSKNPLKKVLIYFRKNKFYTFF